MSTVLAIDIGGTKVAAGWVSSDGRLRHPVHLPTEADSAEALFETVVRLGLQVLELAGAAPSAIGVGCGGPARQHHRLVSPLNIAVWRDFPLGERLAERFVVPTFVDNDAKALALGEGWLGAARGVANYIGMVVSTGVGGGIVLEGRLLDGADGNAGHIGHVFVEPGGHTDAAGAVGNLEGQASGSALARITGRPAAEAPPDLRRRTGELVGRAVASVANLLDLQLAVVAGSVALGYGEEFFSAAQATIDELCRLDHSRGTRIVPGALGADGPLLGAGAVGLRGLGVDVLADGARQVQ
ncbi:MAG: ROK family protein [Acidimicrobiales bacterium]|nr:ROK family protein [Acidimicrobiales bacterium]